jgi:hypothetical protein
LAWRHHPQSGDSHVRQHAERRQFNLLMQKRTSPATRCCATGRSWNRRNLEQKVSKLKLREVAKRM